MRAFVCEIDDQGLRHVLPEDVLPAEDLSRLARTSTAFVWALLDEPDAEDLRREVHSGRTHDASGLLLSRAVEFLPMVATLPLQTSPPRPTTLIAKGPTTADRERRFHRSSFAAISAAQNGCKYLKLLTFPGRNPLCTYEEHGKHPRNQRPPGGTWTTETRG